MVGVLVIHSQRTSVPDVRHAGVTGSRPVDSGATLPVREPGGRDFTRCAGVARWAKRRSRTGRLTGIGDGVDRCPERDPGCRPAARGGSAPEIRRDTVQRADARSCVSPTARIGTGFIHSEYRHRRERASDTAGRTARAGDLAAGHRYNPAGRRCGFTRDSDAGPVAPGLTKGATASGGQTQVYKFCARHDNLYCRWLRHYTLHT